MTAAASIGALPHALRDEGELTRRFAGRRPAIFLDYDGTLTPIVDRPEDAVISQSMRQAVRGLAERCPLCVVSGRDRRVVQELMGVDDLMWPEATASTSGARRRARSSTRRAVTSRS
jgi:trehalose 6-phosphate phosphatase